MEHRLLANCVEDHDGPLFEGSRCWLWVGKIDKSGYGVLTVRWKSGPRKGKVRCLKAHRESVRVFTGRTVRRDYVIRHGCNVRCCINPAHLRGGTHKSNVHDMLACKRHWSGLLLGRKFGLREFELQRMKALANRERCRALSTPVVDRAIAMNDESCEDLDSTFRRFG